MGLSPSPVFAGAYSNHEGRCPSTLEHAGRIRASGYSRRSIQGSWLVGKSRKVRVCGSAVLNTGFNRQRQLQLSERRRRLTIYGESKPRYMGSMTVVQEETSGRECWKEFGLRESSRLLRSAHEMRNEDHAARPAGKHSTHQSSLLRFPDV